MSINKDNFEEHLFKASEKHAYPFQEDDWDVLEALLEKKKKRRAFIFWLNGLGLLLIASTFAVYFAMHDDKEQEAKKGFTIEEKSVANTTITNDESAITNKSSAVAETQSNENIHTTHKRVAGTEQIEIKNAVPVNNKFTSTFSNTTQYNIINNDSPKSEEFSKPALEEKLNEPVTAEMNLVVSGDAIQPVVAENSIAKKSDSLLVTNDSLMVKADSLLAKLNNDTIAKLVAAEKKKKAKDSTKYSRVSVLFSVTPDLSFTQLVDFSKLQLSAYLGAEVNITRNFSALLGAAYSNKSYAARGSDYTPGKPKFWTGGVKPQEVIGSCNVIDMSVALRYYHAFNATGKTRFFAEAGSSSYLMMKEHYDFIYTTPNSSLIQEWNVKSGIVYSFSVLNFGLGLERKIKEHWMIQANPKFQMPLSALGWGSVKFSSAGLNMSLKYSF